MRTRKKVGIGCGLLVVLLVLAGFAMWFFAPGAPSIAVDDPGDGGTRITLNDRPANFFPGQGEGPRPAILMLGGSEGGLREAHNKMARQLVAEGFAVLYPGYYRTSEETKLFDMVPLETFDEAIRFLESRDDVDASRIGAMGVSKGSEGVLFYASRNPAIDAVVAIVPSNVVWQGFDWETLDMSQFRSSWSVNGKPVAYLPYDQPEWYEMMTGGILAMYENSLKGLPSNPEAEIRIEEIDGPVLLLCGEADNLWPSCSMSRDLQRRSRENGKQDVELIAYPKGGHMIYGRPRDPEDENYDQLDQMGGTKEGNNGARIDAWPRIVTFFKKTLGDGGDSTSGS